MTPEERQQVIQALEGAAVAKLADGTYLDKDCKITTALAIMRRDAEPKEPKQIPAWVNAEYSTPWEKLFPRKD
jgi:hypothetical protein